MEALLNLNGILVPAAEARVSLLDHGLLYGDGLFETLAVREGKLFRTERPLARLGDGARRLALALPGAQAALENALRETVRANQMEDAVPRLTVTRGEGPPV